MMDKTGLLALPLAVVVAELHYQMVLPKILQYVGMVLRGLLDKLM
jgi:hypothetical protein